VTFFADISSALLFAGPPRIEYRRSMHKRSRLLLSASFVSAMVVVVGCADNVPSVQIQPLPEAQPVRYYSGITTQQRLVVRDAATWASTWQQIVSRIQPPPPVPMVDFASNLVIVAAMGTKPTGGYSIDVDNVRISGPDASISVTEQSPGSGCVVTQAETAPVAVVLVPQFTGQATFIEHSTQLACR
jgi:hypothetical protein